MIENPEGLIEDFQHALTLARLAQRAVPVRHECLTAPHRQSGLPLGHGAVYVFSLPDDHASPAAGRALKVGRVGPNSDARFRSQHYSPKSSGSNLARTLLTARVMWPHLGIKELDEADVKTWILTNTERDHFFLSADHAGLLPSLETYVRGRLGPMFEGG